MSNRKHVCFKCRASVRREQAADRIVLCPVCGAETVNIGYKIPVPPKSKIKEWQALESQLKRESAEMAESSKLLKVRRIHEIEKELLKLEALPTNEGRRSLLKELKQELARANA